MQRGVRLQLVEKMVTPRVGVPWLLEVIVTLKILVVWLRQR